MQNQDILSQYKARYTFGKPVRGELDVVLSKVPCSAPYYRPKPVMTVCPPLMSCPKLDENGCIVGAQVAKTVKDFFGSLNDVVKSKDIAAITEQSDDPNWYCNCGKNILMEVSLTDKNSGEVRKAQKVIELKDTRLDLS